MPRRPSPLFVYWEKTMPVLRIFLAAFLLLALSLSGAFAMEPMSEKEMAGMSAGSGIALALSDVKIYRHDPYLAYQDTGDGDNRMELGDTSSFYTFQSFAPIYVRVYENQDELMIAALEALGEDGKDAMDKAVSVIADHYTFLSQELGGFRVDNHHTRELALYLAPADQFDGLNNADGLAFQLETRAGLDTFRWAYQDGQDSSEAFVLGNVDAAESFDSDGNPLGRFCIGDLNPRDENSGGTNPASLQVLKNQDGNPFVRMNLPMAGSLRAEQVQMAGHDLGPVRIDGLRVHHLKVDFRPF